MKKLSFILRKTNLYAEKYLVNDDIPILSV